MKKVPYGKRNLKYYIKKTFIENEYSCIDDIKEKIVQYYKDKYITESDRKLLNLFFKKDVSQADLDKFLEEWDIEREGGHKALMLSYFMKIHPELDYSQYIGPRLNGILKYYRFNNLKLLANFKKICTAIKAQNIDILILKGGAFKHYNPEFPRIMGDIDILVNEADYEKAKQTAIGLGYKYKEFKHSVDIHDPVTDNNLFDLHHRLDMQTGIEALLNEPLFKRAKLEKVFGVDGVYVPCPEDMMFILLINLNKNLARYTSLHSILYSIIDSRYLLDIKPDFSWNIVKQNAILTKTKPQISLAVKFLNEFVSDKLPNLFDKEFDDETILYLYNKWFLKSLRKRSHSLTIWSVFNNFLKDLAYYFKFRFLYVVYKQKMIRNDVKLAKKVLEKQSLIR